MSAVEDRVAAVRAFNRFYTARIGVVGEGLLRTEHTLAEARLLMAATSPESDDPAQGQVEKDYSDLVRFELPAVCVDGTNSPAVTGVPRSRGRAGEVPQSSRRGYERFRPAAHTERARRGSGRTCQHGRHVVQYSLDVDLYSLPHLARV